MSTALPIRYAVRPAANGIDWLKRAFAMFRSAPLPWVLLAFTYYLLVALAERTPLAIIGQFLAPALKPVFAVGFLAAAWTQERGGRPQLKLLFRGFSSNLYVLVPLGIFFMAGMTVAVFSTTLVDDGELIGMVAGTVKPTEEAWRSGRMQLALLMGILCSLPTVLALWFAPALVVFDDAGFAAALSTSTRAALANWRPLSVYALCVFGLGGLLPLVMISFLGMLHPVVAGAIGLFVLAPYAMTLVVSMHVSDYISYQDIFHPDAPAAAPR